MDLGSSICLPRTPIVASVRCGRLPSVRAKADGRFAAETKKKRRPGQFGWPPARLPTTGGVTCCSATDKGLLAGMWEFPTVTALPEEDQRECLRRFFRQILGSPVVVEEMFLDVVHTFSHRRWYLTSLLFVDCRGEAGRRPVRFGVRRLTGKTCCSPVRNGQAAAALVRMLSPQPTGAGI